MMLFVLSFVLSLVVPRPAQPAWTQQLYPCAIKDVDGDVRCGTIHVWEDRSRQSRRISLYVVVLKAKSGIPVGDAFFAIQGGPGQSVTQLADFYGRLLTGVRERRDIVLLDVRGTGRSNPLNCLLHLPESDSTDLFPVERIQKCRAELEEHSDLRQYTTSNIVADIDDVRAVLGYQQISFYGTSYGTRVAVEYLRRYPARVRTMTLKGVVPPSLISPLTHAPDAHRALNDLLDRCEADPKCHQAFPRSRLNLQKTVEALRRGAVRFDLQTSSGTRGVTITLGLFGEALRNLLYSPQSAASVPLILDRIEKGDWSEIAAIVDRTKQTLNGQLSVGMFLSVTCTEDTLLIKERNIWSTAIFGAFRVRQQQQACRVWTRGFMPRDFHRAVRSNRPVLLISGEDDPVTPPRFGKEVAQTLPNSLNLVVPNNGHPMGGLLPCASQLISQLTERGTTKGLDTSCARGMSSTNFQMPRDER